LSFIELLPLLISAISAAVTLYFWLVKANEERPWLNATPVDLGVMVRPGPTEQTRWLGLEIKLAVTNLSLRPDVLTAVTVRYRDAKGQWAAGPRPADVHHGSNTQLPIKLASYHSVGVSVWVWVEVPQQSREIRHRPEYLEYVRAVLPTPLRLRVELTGIGGDKFVDDVQLDV
jgi:hypothetical protein